MVTSEPRSQQLLDWFREWSGSAAATLQVVSGDASFRRYHRAQGASGSVILVDSPPDKEKNEEFIAIAAALSAAGIRVPGVLAADLRRGFLAIEDLGDQLLLPLLTAERADTFYERASRIHRRLALADTSKFQIPVYDTAELLREMNLFVDWFCPQLLGLGDDAESRNAYEALCHALCARATAQIQVVVHRDFHARNLMVQADGGLAVIDFQDAILGPITYDLVSLLKDCYLRWPAHRVREWALLQRENLLDDGFDLPEAGAFLQDFDWMGLQRHLKVLGIFSRLYLRDGKDAYLQDLPRVIAYVRETLAAYPDNPALVTFGEWFEERVMPSVTEQPWFADGGIP